MVLRDVIIGDNRFLLSAFVRMAATTKEKYFLAPPGLRGNILFAQKPSQDGRNSGFCCSLSHAKYFMIILFARTSFGVQSTRSFGPQRLTSSQKPFRVKNLLMA